jgi:hypothetical protein
VAVAAPTTANGEEPSLLRAAAEPPEPRVAKPIVTPVAKPIATPVAKHLVKAAAKPVAKPAPKRQRPARATKPACSSLDCL